MAIVSEGDRQGRRAGAWVPVVYDHDANQLYPVPGLGLYEPVCKCHSEFNRMWLLLALLVGILQLSH